MTFHSIQPVIPTIETDRLVLRGHTADDLEDSFAMWSNPEVTRYIGGRPSTREEVWGRLLRYVGHWQLLGFGYWVVAERRSERFVGEVGFARYERDLPAAVGELRDLPEGGWVLMPWAHGQGYATEAVRAAHAHACTEGHFGQDARTMCLIGPENTASLRVAAKCGYRERMHTVYGGRPAMVLERGVAPPSSAVRHR